MAGFQALCGGDKAGAEGLAVWLASRDGALLAGEAAAGVTKVKLNGADYVLRVGEHFSLSAADEAALLLHKQLKL
eukprot:8656239-Pyramimonas_sp.AAC.1